MILIYGFVPFDHMPNTLQLQGGISTLLQLDKQI